MRKLALAAAFAGATMGAFAEARTVQLESGLNVLEEPMVLTAVDSGTRYVGAADGSTVLSGGQKITNWTDRGDGIWAAPAPFFFESLFVNGRRAVRAREPNTGFFHVKSIVRDANNVVVGIGLNSHEADLVAAVPAADLPYVHFTAHMAWQAQTHPLAGFDGAKKEIAFSGIKDNSWNRLAVTEQYFLENLRSAFDAEGEWFYDATANEVLYRPLPGETIETIEAIAPKQGFATLMTIDGAEDVTFENVTFAYSTPSASIGPSRHESDQAAIDEPSAVKVSDVRRVTFHNCSFLHTGATALYFVKNCTSNVVESCRFEDLGAGGVKIGPFSGGSAMTGATVLPPAATSFNMISNCVFREGGRVVESGTGVHIGHSSDNAVIGNTIEDFYYSGITVGWVWGYDGSYAQRNQIGFNRISKIGQKVLSDMGGIYTLGTSFGTRIFNNVIFDIGAFSYGGWGIYFDEGSEGIVAENNLVYDTSASSFHQHYGRDNVLRNNIFSYQSECPVAVTKAENHRSLTIEGNIFCWASGDALGGAAKNATIDWASNLWWRTSGTPTFGGQTYAQWAVNGRDEGGRVADPSFVDAPNRDLRLMSNSPALKMGFRPFEQVVPLCSPVGVAKRRDEGGTVVGYDLSFSATDKAGRLYGLLGTADRGETLDDWDEIVDLGSVEAGATSYFVSADKIDFGIGKTYPFARFVLAAGSLYAGLDCVETDGSQYFDTGLKAYSQNTIAFVDYQLKSPIATQNRILMSRGTTTYSGVGDYGNHFEAYINGSSQFAVCKSPANGIGIVAATTSRTQLWMDSVAKKASFTFDGHTYAANDMCICYGSENTASPSTIEIFRHTSEVYTPGRIYQVTITNNNACAANFIPARSGDAVGMYDTVTGDFKGSATLAPFVAGEPTGEILGKVGAMSEAQFAYTGVVPKPDLGAARKAWSGDSQRPKVALSKAYTVDYGVGNWTDVGDYTATVTLNEGYCWPDFTTEAHVFSMTIYGADRPIAVAKEHREHGVLVSNELSFPASGSYAALYRLCGAVDRGATTNGWDSVAILTAIGPGTNTWTDVIPPEIASSEMTLRIRYLLAPLTDVYVGLDCVETDGSQYFDTGLKAYSQNTIAFVDYQLKSQFVPQNRILMSRGTTTYSGVGDYGNHFEAYINGSSQFAVCRSPANGIGIVAATTSRTQLWMDSVAKKASFTFDGHTYAANDMCICYGSKNTASPSTIEIFRHTNEVYTPGRIYQVTITNNNACAANFIPVRSGDAVGMYDTVTGDFKGSATLVPFVAGEPTGEILGYKVAEGDATGASSVLASRKKGFMIIFKGTNQ